MENAQYCATTMKKTVCVASIHLMLSVFSNRFIAQSNLCVIPMVTVPKPEVGQCTYNLFTVNLLTSLSSSDGRASACTSKPCLFPCVTLRATWDRFPGAAYFALVFSVGWVRNARQTWRLTCCALSTPGNHPYRQVIASALGFTRGYMLNGTHL